MTKEEVKNENILKVMQEAVCCFKEYGVDKTLIKTLATRVGISERSIQRYFVDKKDLVVQSISFYMRPSREDLLLYAESKEFKSMNGITQCEAYFRYMFYLLSEDPSLILLESELQLYLWHAEDYTIYEVQTNKVKSVLVNSLEKGVRDGTIKQGLDIPVLVETMIRRFKGFIQSVPTCKKGVYVIDSLSEKCFEQGLDLFLTYIKV